MRSRPVAATLVALTAVAATAARRRFAARRRAALSAPAVPVAVPHAVPVVPVRSAVPVMDRDAVVLAFARPGVPSAVPVPASAPVRPAAPARCGDNGGRTKAGAPCGARATSGGRCHHHPIAA